MQCSLVDADLSYAIKSFDINVMCIHVVHIKTHNKGCEGLHFILITSVFINTLNKPVCCMLRVNYLIILLGLLRGVRGRSTDV